MPENEFSSRNNGHDEDAAQNHKHLDELTADELTDALSDMWDAMDENNYDPAQMDAYLSELEKREPISPGFNVDASLAAFQEKHAQLFAQTAPVQKFSAAKPVHHRRWRASLVAAIIAVMMICSMITAQAFGFDVFGAIARWTEETFRFSTSAQTSGDQQNIPVPETDGEYATLQDALDAYGILETVSPQWYPTGLKTTEISISHRETGITIRADYEADGKLVSVFVRQFVTAEDAAIGIGTFEKDNTNVVQYERNGIVHYIVSNNSYNTATWTNDTLVCSISGDLTVNEMEKMINSIYGDES